MTLSTSTKTYYIKYDTDTQRSQCLPVNHINITDIVHSFIERWLGFNSSTFFLYVKSLTFTPLFDVDSSSFVEYCMKFYKSIVTRNKYTLTADPLEKRLNYSRIVHLGWRTHSRHRILNDLTFRYLITFNITTFVFYLGTNFPNITTKNWVFRVNDLLTLWNATT